MKHSTTIIQLVVAALIFILIGAGSILLHARILEKNKSVAVLVSKTAAEEDKGALLADLKKALKETSEIRGKIDKLILSEDRVPQFAEMTEGFGRVVGAKVSFGAIDKGPNSDTEFGTEYLSAAVNITGPWQAVLATIKMIENAPYALLVNKVNVTRVSASETVKKNSWEATVYLNVLKYK